MRTEFWVGKLEKLQLKKVRMRLENNVTISVRYVGV